MDVTIQEAGVVLEWTANAINDSIADAIVATILQIESIPASIKCTSFCFFVVFAVIISRELALQVLHQLDHGEGSGASVVDLPVPPTSTKVKREKRAQTDEAAENEVATLIDQLQSKQPKLDVKHVEKALGEHFGKVSLDTATGVVAFEVDGHKVEVNAVTFEIMCDSDIIRKPIQHVVERIAAAIRPL